MLRRRPERAPETRRRKAEPFGPASAAGRLSPGVEFSTPTSSHTRRNCTTRADNFPASKSTAPTIARKAATFASWASEAPDDFMFSLKGPRYATNRRVLAEAGDSIKRFFDSGVTELGDKLGPILWQFAPTKKFMASDFGAFLDLLPEAFDGRKLSHAIEVRHDLFCTPEFIDLAGRNPSRSFLPTTPRIRRSPTLPVISSTPACKQVRIKYQLHISRTHSNDGRRAQRHGPQVACQTIFRSSIRRQSQSGGHAMCSSTSFMKARCARRLQQWLS